MTGPAPQLIGIPGRVRRAGRDPSAGGAAVVGLVARPPGSGVAAGRMGRRRETVHR